MFDEWYFLERGIMKKSFGSKGTIFMVLMYLSDDDLDTMEDMEQVREENKINFFSLRRTMSHLLHHKLN